MKTSIEKQIERAEKRKEFFEKLLYSTEYMDWLMTFSKKIPQCSADAADAEMFPIEDRKQLGCLPFFFEAIQEYSSENYIYPYKEPLGEYYSIQYKGIGFDIGVDYGQGSFFYYRRLPVKRNSALDFKHLMSSVKLPETLLYDCKLEELVTFIEHLHEEDHVPLDAIRFKVEDTVQKIKNRENS